MPTDIEVRSFEEVIRGITSGQPALVTLPDALKAEQVALLSDRLDCIEDAPNDAMRNYWKGVAMGELNLLARLEVFSLLETYVWRNRVCKAMGEREPHGQLDMRIAQDLEKKGIRLR
jgi:hypothetical protein